MNCAGRMIAEIAIAQNKAKKSGKSKGDYYAKEIVAKGKKSI